MTDLCPDTFDPQAYLEFCVTAPESKIQIGALALAMVSDMHEGVPLGRYLHHFNKMTSEVTERHAALQKAGGTDDPPLRLAALKHVISDLHGYQCDQDGHDILESADIIRVIDRAQGCGAALAILYMDCARAQGWPIEGLNVPGHFLCRLEHQGVRLIFDPAANGKMMEAHHLREYVKDALGEDAELSAAHITGLDARQTVVHLCNLIKYRYIESASYEHALALVQRMLQLLPSEYRLLLDSGVLYARTGDIPAAKESLTRYLDHAPTDQDAILLLSNLPPA